VPSAAPAEAAPPPETGARPAGGPPRPGRSAPGGLTSAGARDLLKTAQTLLKAQRYQEASQAFKRLLPLRRERGMALVGLGNIAFQERNYADAVTRAHEAGKAGGGVAARLLLGDAYFKLQRFAEAKKAYYEAVRLDPASDTARRGQERAARRLN
jgi:tetratricopeptide (TPR) repeat protein